jgi:hypothetical protein
MNKIWIPIELIMLIYEYCSPQEKAIINQIYKFNYKLFNPIKTIFKAKFPLSGLLGSFVIGGHITINGYEHIRTNATHLVPNLLIKNDDITIDLISVIKSLRKKIRNQNDKIEILMNLLMHKKLIPHIVLD